MRPDDPRHGSSGGYVAGCHDECCLTAKRRYDKRRRLELHRTGNYRKLPAFHAERRLQALQRLGWSIPALAARLGVSHQSLYGVGRQPTVYRSNFNRIADLYDELSMTLPPVDTLGQRLSAAKARNYAERMGWAPPLAWDDIDDPNAKPAGMYREHRRKTEVDEAVVRRFMAGENLRTTVAEKQQIVARWRVEGVAWTEIERRTGWKVERYLEPPAREAS